MKRVSALDFMKLPSFGGGQGSSRASPRDRTSSRDTDSESSPSMLGSPREQGKHQTQGLLRRQSSANSPRTPPTSVPRHSITRRSSSNVGQDDNKAVATKQLCEKSQRDLIVEGIKSFNFCPYCSDLGVLCAVSVHHGGSSTGGGSGNPSPRSDYSASTLSPRGVIRRMQKKYSSTDIPNMNVVMEQKCRNSRQTLLARGTKISDFCPLCKLHGVLCAVAVHHNDYNDCSDDDSFSPLSPRNTLTPRGAMSPSMYQTTPQGADVYVLCESSANGNVPLTICFAVSNKYLLSNQHFMKGNLRTSYVIALSVTSGPNGSYVFPKGYRPVKVRCFNEKMDYSLLELQDGVNDLVPIASLSLDDMLDVMDLDPEDPKQSTAPLVNDITESEFRIKMRHLSFM